MHHVLFRSYFFNRDFLFKLGLRGWLLSVLVFYVFSAEAVIEVRRFNDPDQQALYQELIQELRCLVCQNQNLADSNADLAKDLRQQTFEMIKTGADKDQVVDYMVKRYGDFVLYRPPWKASTLVLWVGPFVLLMIGVGIIITIIKKRGTSSQLSETERKQARKLLDQ